MFEQRKKLRACIASISRGWLVSCAYACGRYSSLAQGQRRVGFTSMGAPVQQSMATARWLNAQSVLISDKYGVWCGGRQADWDSRS